MLNPVFGWRGSAHHKVMGGGYKQIAGFPSEEAKMSTCDAYCAKLQKYEKKCNEIVKNDVQNQKHMV